MRPAAGRSGTLISQVAAQRPSFVGRQPRAAVTAMRRHARLALARPPPTRTAVATPWIGLPAFPLALQMLAQFQPPLLALGIVALTCRCLPGDHQGEDTQQRT